jgi:hypothetical protein
MYVSVRYSGGKASFWVSSLDDIMTSLGQILYHCIVVYACAEATSSICWRDESIESGHTHEPGAWLDPPALEYMCISLAAR